MKSDSTVSSDPIPADAVQNGAVNVPVVAFAGLHELRIDPDPGALRYEVSLEERATAEMLLINKSSHTLVVALHGMMVPGHHHLPRFEWLRTLQENDYSCLYLSDPTLQADDQLHLGWYLGWEDLDLYPVVARIIRQVAINIGADRIVLAGSSGGGYASLQISSLIPGSIAVAFNAQTDIAKYHWKHQYRFISRVMPHLLLRGKQRKGWARALGMRSSALTRYKYARQNHILCVQNTNDPHHLHEHFEPFKALIERSPNRDRAVFDTYEGPEAHEPPSRGRFRSTIDQAVKILMESQGADAEELTQQV